MKKYIIILMVITLFFSAFTALAETFAFVKIEGNDHVSTNFIMSKLLDLKAGKPIDRDTLYKDLQDLYNTGFFSYIEPKVEPSPLGVGLIVKVIENPFIKDIKLEIEGPELISKDKIKKAITVKKNDVLNLNDLKGSFQAILKLYTDKGYVPNMVGIQTNITQNQNSLELPNGILVITVKEYAIWNLKLEGEYGRLTSQKVVKETGLFTLKEFESLNPLMKFFVDFKQAYPKISDIQAFQSKLAEMGYFSPQTSLSFAPTSVSTSVFKYPVMDIVVHSSLKKVIKSGLPFQGYFISGVSEVNPFSLSKYAGISAPGTTDNFTQLDQLEKIRSYYKSKGYLLTAAYLKYHKYLVISKSGLLEYKVIQRYIGNVQIVGNTKTKEYLIRREIQFKKGDPLTAQALVQTYNNLKNTGFFSDVSIYPRLTSEDSSAVDVVIKVVESSKPRKFNVALTVGQPKEGQPWYSGIKATGKLGLSNWAGIGQNFDAGINLGQESNAHLDYGIIFPFNLPMNANASLYYKTLKPFKTVNEKNIYYNETRYGLSSTIGYQPNVHMSFNIGGHFEWFQRSEDATPVDFGPASGTSRELNFTFNYVNVDNILSPMKGAKISFGAKLAGFGGTEKYQTYTAMAAGYLPLLPNLSIAGRVLIGTSSGKDFQVGGSTTVRGWKPRSGLQELITNLSLRWTLPSNLPITLNAFYDWGGAKDDLLSEGNLDYDFMNSIGVGVAAKIPYLGVLRVDFPFKAENGNFEYSGMTFGIGQMF
ncbi:BamA/OMP85 family outer membrane protein [Mesoaciditoga lauensis]|uniref:BamA/OMP85 family outer membrane protein n=1 Tax=Mesoaciditoga lauensis TaxID=1495039 RepID=UPI00056C0F66|nr:POTRA domain-containing protein [Mesoaciditoga lauensis]